MADVVQAIQSAIEIVARLRTLSKKIEDAEFKMLLADLSSDLADAKLEVANLKVKLAALTDTNRELSTQLGSRATEKPEFVDGAYRFEGDDGIYCTACFDSSQKKVRVTALKPPFTRFGKWRCPSCGATTG